MHGKPSYADRAAALTETTMWAAGVALVNALMAVWLVAMMDQAGVSALAHVIALVVGFQLVDLDDDRRANRVAARATGAGLMAAAAVALLV